MRMKSIALWLLAAILAAVLFYLFRAEMVPKDANQVSQAVISNSLARAF